MEISPRLTYEEWVEIYKKITFWELKLEKSAGRRDEPGTENAER